MKIMKRLDKSGQAMVEMAFVIFVLVILIFAITEFGRAMYTKNTLTNAARAGARAAVVTSGISDVILSQGSLANDCTSYTCPNSANPQECVYKAVCNSIVSTDLRSKTGINLDVLERAAGVAAQSGDTVQVTVQANFQSVVPRLFGPNGWIPFFPSSLAGIASMRQEQ
jgi:Flp pilus assembly protein TadG